MPVGTLPTLRERWLGARRNAKVRPLPDSTTPSGPTIGGPLSNWCVSARRASALSDCAIVSICVRDAARLRSRGCNSWGYAGFAARESVFDGTRSSSETTRYRKSYETFGSAPTAVVSPRIGPSSGFASPTAVVGFALLKIRCAACTSVNGCFGAAGAVPLIFACRSVMNLRSDLDNCCFAATFA